MVLRDGKGFGADAPRVCAPAAARDLRGVLAAARRAARAADIVEWRADYYRGKTPYPEAALHIRQAIGDTPLIFTLRASNEGGAKQMDEAARLAAIEAVARSGLADFADVELRAGAEAARRAAAGGTRLIVSYHDFERTPGVDEMVDILRAEAAAGADAAKIAVTPQSPDDALALLTAAGRFRAEAAIPFIAVAMGELGKLTRAYGHVFGSAMTFGALGASTAPGQLPARLLAQILRA